MMRYTVEPNWCACHPETCCCKDWVVQKPDGQRHSTFMERGTAEEVAQALNAAAVRSTWATVDGRKCEHCGKGIIHHAGQVYCPDRA